MMYHEQTPAEHARQKAWVLAAELLAPTRAQRHGVYAARRKRVPAIAPVVVVVAPSHVFVMPVVAELKRL